jgi:hypothetical protein
MFGQLRITKCNLMRHFGISPFVEGPPLSLSLSLSLVAPTLEHRAALFHFLG